MGKSLILGGFYDYNQGEKNNGVPLLSDIPVVGNLFKYDEGTMEKVSLVFIITPSAYNASNYDEIDYINEETRVLSGMEAHEMNQISARLFPQNTAPYQPTQTFDTEEHHQSYGKSQPNYRATHEADTRNNTFFKRIFSGKLRMVPPRKTRRRR